MHYMWVGGLVAGVHYMWVGGLVAGVHYMWVGGLVNIVHIEVGVVRGFVAFGNGRVISLYKPTTTLQT